MYGMTKVECSSDHLNIGRARPFRWGRTRIGQRRRRVHIGASCCETPSGPPSRCYSRSTSFLTPHWCSVCPAKHHPA
ncbi:unnamed protein product [Mycena citricolor]|uniref:Uncharacterized protein n=1 Tax=Mycena citricolor TaxID=2018698 RepID=A0AAD2HSD1_9AGAR|nr:unnamed protein product [Mycena citricolor]